MNRAMVVLLSSFLGIFTSGCQSPKFTHNAPPAKLRSDGPSILVMPLEDTRLDRDMDLVFEKGYLDSIQQAIGDELRSAEVFQSVIVITNLSNLPPADLKLNSRLKELAWEVPDYDSLLAKTFFISLLTGGIGGCIYVSTGTDVYGHAAFEIHLTTTSGAQAPLNFSYSGNVTNHMAKVSSDMDSTKAVITIQAFDKLMEPMKQDLRKQLVNLGSTTNFPAK